MPPHVISACAACAGDVRNARDRCKPIGQSRTAPCGASHFQRCERRQRWEPKVRPEKKVLPAGQTTFVRAPPLRGVLGRTFIQLEPAGRAHYGCQTLPEARSEAWAWGRGA